MPQNQQQLPSIPIWNRKLFWLGIVLKLILGATLASTYYSDLFIPFLNQFVSSGFQDPYHHWAGLDRMEMFPYPAFMLYVLALPRVLLGFLFNPNNPIGLLDLLVYRLPLLAADIVLLLILQQWTKGKQHQLLVLFWLSPVLVYITYIHGQLDIIPITLLFSSMYFQFKDKFWLSTLLLALSLATKTNMVIAVPFYLWYLHTRQVPLWKIGVHAVLIPFIFLAVNLPFLNSPAFWNMVFANREQGKVFNLSLPYALGLSVFLLPAAYYLVVVRSLAFRFFNKDLYVMFLGFSFGLLMILIPPMQGWYFWIIPFFIYFLLKQAHHQRLKVGFYGLTFLFFCYFAIVPKSDFFQVFQIVWPNVAGTPNLFQLISGLGFKDSHFLGLVFTILQTTLAINCGLIYQFGINETLRHKIKYKPYLIGVGGDSGSGKSTFTQHIADLFGTNNVSVIRGDDMHRWERGDEQWQHITHLNPKANHLHHDLQHAKSLKAGRTVDRRQYDHADGKFTLPVAVRANRVIINEGLHPFYLSHTRKLFDCKIFINPEERLRQHWKIVRDMAKRGYSKTQIVDQILARAKDAERYILVQGRYADIIVSYQLKEELQALGNPDESYELVLSCQLDNNVNLDPLVLALGGIETLLVVQNYINEDSQTILFDGTVKAQQLEIILADLVPELQEITIQPAQLADNYNGLLQLLVAYYVFNKLEME